MSDSDNLWTLVIIALVMVVGWLVWKTNKLELAGSNMMPISSLDNRQLQKGQAAKPTKLLAHKVIVHDSGSPVRFPYGRVTSGEVRLSTRGNTGAIYLSDSYAGAKAGINRFGIVPDSSIPFEVQELSTLWLDADNNNDGVEVLAGIESNV